MKEARCHEKVHIYDSMYTEFKKMQTNLYSDYNGGLGSRAERGFAFYLEALTGPLCRK